MAKHRYHNTLDKKHHVGGEIPSKQISDNKNNMESIKAVKDENSKRVKPKKYEPLIELWETYGKLNENDFNKMIDSRLPAIMEPINDQQPPGKVTLYTFIQNVEELLPKYLSEYSRKEENPTQKELYTANISALATRILRFRIRLITLDVLICSAPRRPIAIQEKLKQILSSLKNKVIILDFENNRLEYLCKVYPLATRLDGRALYDSFGRTY